MGRVLLSEGSAGGLGYPQSVGNPGSGKPHRKCGCKGIEITRWSRMTDEISDYTHPPAPRSMSVMAILQQRLAR
jgi:hypothetical protein